MPVPSSPEERLQGAGAAGDARGELRGGARPVAPRACRLRRVLSSPLEISICKKPPAGDMLTGADH